MPSLKVASEIAKELQNTRSWRDAGVWATSIGAAIIAALPGIGGPVSVAVDKLGSRFFDADLEPKFRKLCTLVASLEPHIEKIADLDQRVAEISATVIGNASLTREFREIVGALNSRADLFEVSTLGGEQTFVDVAIENMNVFALARAGGVNRFHRVQTNGGDVRFHSSGGGEQHVSQSVFRGKTGSVSMDGLVVRGQVATQNSGGSAGVGLGPGGMIGFARDGAIMSFGPAQPQPRPVTLLTIPISKLRPS